MSRHFAMLVPSSQARPAVPAETRESGLRAGLASRVLFGPGLWPDWLEEAGRRGLIEELLAGGVIEETVATAPHGHQLGRVLSAKNTLLPSAAATPATRPRPACPAPSPGWPSSPS